MQRLEVSGAVRLIYRSLGAKGLTTLLHTQWLYTYKNTTTQTPSTFFDVLLTVYLSIILVINQLHAQNLVFVISLLYASTCFEHYVLIIRRSKFYYTASGIITPIGDRPVHRLRESSLNLQVLRYQMLYNTILTS